MGVYLLCSGVCADGLSRALWRKRKQLCAQVVVKLMGLLAYWKPEQLSLHSLHLHEPWELLILQ